MERVVTARGDDMKNDEYLQEVCGLIGEAPTIRCANTFFGGTEAVCTISMHRYTDPTSHADRWAVCFEAEDYEVRDYDNPIEAEAAYRVLQQASASDGVMWSIYE